MGGSITGELHALTSATMLVGCIVSLLATATIPEGCPHTRINVSANWGPSINGRRKRGESSRNQAKETTVNTESSSKLRCPASCTSSKVPPGRRTGRYIVTLTVTLAADQAERADMAYLTSLHHARRCS